jgi:hypothetical protein
MTETAVIMLLTRDVSIFQQKGSSAAVRVAKLLRARLKEIESVYDLESYFRKLYALRAIRFVHRTPDNDDTWKSDVISGWGNFDDCHTEMWPRVLLTSIVRSKADARLTIDGAEEDGIVAWTEHLSLTLGFQNDRVEIFLRFDSHFGIWPTGSAWFQPCYRDAPWFWWGLPPPMNDGEVITMFGPPMAQNGSNTSRTISFKIKHGFTKRTGDHWDKEANERRQAKLRLEHFDSETITEWLSGREFMLIESQHLPRLVDPEAILCPPEMAHEPIALLEGVLLGRKAIYEKTSDPHFGNYESVPTFIDELDRVAKLLTTSFDDWRKISEGLAVADHNRLLTESLQRAANLVQSVDYEVLTTEPALENGRVTYALTKQEERIANNGDEA